MNKQTNGEVYGPAMDITEQAVADSYFEELVRDQMKLWGTTREQAEGIIRQNLGYYAGYYDKETMTRVSKLFKTRHPYLCGLA